MRQVHRAGCAGFESGSLMAVEEITCPMCGFKNPADLERCGSCGAKIEALVTSYTPEEEYARRYQQEDFEWKWALIAAALISAVQGLVLGLLPMAISSFDPQGFAGLLLSIPIAFVHSAWFYLCLGPVL